MEASQNMYIVLKPQMSIKYVLTQGSSFRLVVNEDMAVQKKKNDRILSTVDQRWLCLDAGMNQLEYRNQPSHLIA